MLNWGLIKHPLNWATVLLMVLFASLAIDLLSKFFVQPSGDGQS